MTTILMMMILGMMILVMTTILMMMTIIMICGPPLMDFLHSVTDKSTLVDELNTVVTS